MECWASDMMIWTLDVFCQKMLFLLTNGHRCLMPWRIALSLVGLSKAGIESCFVMLAFKSCIGKVEQHSCFQGSIVFERWILMWNGKWIACTVLFMQKLTASPPVQQRFATRFKRDMTGLKTGQVAVNATYAQTLATGAEQRVQQASHEDMRMRDASLNQVWRKEE